jgi:3-oxoacyl-[acyl-carrier protein] reductase
LSDTIKEKYKEIIPLSRFGQPEDVAKAVLFLASDDSSYITGEVLKINGGLYT